MKNGTELPINVEQVKVINEITKIISYEINLIKSV